MAKTSLEEVQKKIVAFRNARNWKQFHNPKDLAISLVLEAVELLEHFQWKNGADLEKYVKENKKEIANELADVAYWVLLMSHDLKIDIAKVSEEKLKQNAAKYPTKKARGKYTKYNKL